MSAAEVLEDRILLTTWNFSTSDSDIQALSADPGTNVIRISPGGNETNAGDRWFNHYGVPVFSGDVNDQRLVLNFSSGSPLTYHPSGTNFIGGDQINGDILELLGNPPFGSFGTVVYSITGADSGIVSLDGADVDFSEVETVIDRLPAVNRVFRIDDSQYPGDHDIQVTSDPDNPTHALITSVGALGSTAISVAMPSGALMIYSGNGNDQVTIGALPPGMETTVVVNGEDGNDTIVGTGSPTAVQFYGGNGNDSLTGSDFGDQLDGGDGNDLLAGRGDDDRLSGGDGNDTLEGDGGDDFLNGQSDDDVVIGGADDDRLLGGSGNDTLDAGEGRNRISGNAGDDTLQSGSDSDRLYGGPGADVLNAGDGDNTLNGQTGNDTLTGGDDDDRLYGGADDDVLDGGGGADRVRGNAGDDTLSGGEGADTIDGGSGLDWLTETIDQDAVLSNRRLTVQGSDYEWVNRVARIERAILTGTARDNSLVTIDFTARVTLMGEQGDDYLVGGSAADVIDGGEGNDYLRGRQGDDSLTGGDGDDTLNGGRGSDRLFGGDGNDGLSGWTGDDLLSGNMGDDTLLGLSGNDSVMGGGGDDIALGGDDDDRINGQSGRDTVAGNAGTDVIKDDPSEIDESFTFWAAWVDDA